MSWSFLADGIPEAQRVVHGYSTNKRGDLKKILYGSLLTAGGGIPVAGRAMDGNRPDSGAWWSMLVSATGISVPAQDIQTHTKNTPLTPTTNFYCTRRVICNGTQNCPSFSQALRLISKDFSSNGQRF